MRLRHFSDVVGVLSRRRWLAGGVFILVFVYLAASSLRKTPLYEATTQILIEKESRPAASSNAVSKNAELWYDDDFYQTQYKMLQSRTLAWRTLESMGLAKPPAQADRRAAAVAAANLREGGWLGRLAAWLGAPKAILPPAGDETTWQSGRIDEFLVGLTVSPVRNSRLVNLRYLAPDPMFAARAANAIADAYVAQSLSFRAVASQESNTFLSLQLADQKQKLTASEQALRAYADAHGVVSPAEAANNIAARDLADVSAELTRARSDRLALEQVFQTLMALRRDPAKLAASPAIASNPMIQVLTREIADLKSQDAVLGIEFGDQHQKRKDVATQLGIKNAEWLSQAERVVESIGREYQAAKAREIELAGQVEARKNASAAPDTVAIGYLALERAVVGNRRLYEELLTRAAITGVAGEYKGPHVQVVDRAEMPRVPALPNHGRDLSIAVLLGLFLAVTLAFGLEYIDSRIKTPDDIKDHLNLPFLGLIPAVRAKDVKGVSPLLDRGVPPAFSESIRAIRTSVMFSSATEGARTVMVTSTAPSEGKTVVSTNLGDALAQAEQRTLVIDGDMRRPRVHEVYGCTQEPGLSNVLVGAAELKTAIRQTGNPLLSVLPAGLIPPNPAELLGSARYARLLEELAQEYDWIVIDAPPVMAVTDAAVIANGAGGVLFVVGSEMTPRRNAQVALEQLAAARARLVGVVLNRVKRTRHAYHYAAYYRPDYAPAQARSR